MPNCNTLRIIVTPPTLKTAQNVYHSNGLLAAEGCTAAMREDEFQGKGSHLRKEYVSDPMRQFLRSRLPGRDISCGILDLIRRPRKGDVAVGALQMVRRNGSMSAEVLCSCVRASMGDCGSARIDQIVDGMKAAPRGKVMSQSWS